VRDIDDDPQCIAAAYHLHAGIGQAAVHRRLDLDIAEFVHAIVRPLQMPQRVLRVRLIDPIDLAFEKVEQQSSAACRCLNSNRAKKSG